MTFDLAGRRTELVDPVGNSTRWGVSRRANPASHRQVKTSHFEEGKVRRIGLPDLLKVPGTDPIHTISYVHDAASQLTSVSDAYSSYAFGYNDAGWVTSENNSGTPEMPNVVLAHGYNAFGERTSRLDNLGGSTGFAFDLAHRMIDTTLTAGTGAERGTGVVYRAKSNGGARRIALIGVAAGCVGAPSHAGAGFVPRH